jgi:hypothetical protein
MWKGNPEPEAFLGKNGSGTEFRGPYPSRVRTLEFRVRAFPDPEVPSVKQSSEKCRFS